MKHALLRVGNNADQVVNARCCQAILQWYRRQNLSRTASEAGRIRSNHRLCAGQGKDQTQAAYSQFLLFRIHQFLRLLTGKHGQSTADTYSSRNSNCRSNIHTTL